MEFKIKYTDQIEQRTLFYINEECSFNMLPFPSVIDIEIVINKISLMVLNNKTIALSGFCGLDRTMNFNLSPPTYKKGILIVEYNLKHGFAYNINDNEEKEFPVYVNINSGWVCIGNPQQEGETVEFIKKCVAVIDNNKKFSALWLKSQNLLKL